jgi:hypothetical protein
MTSDEFIRRRNSFRNRSAAIALLMVAAMGGAVFLLIHLGGQPDYWSTRLGVLVLFLILAVFVAAMVVPLVFQNWLAKRMGLACPHCHKVVTDMFKSVLASKKCGHCGAVIIDETPGG